MSTALLFPGQGSQFVGMGRELAAQHPEARMVFEAADSLLGEPLSSICFEGPEDLLRETRNTQPAIFVHSLAVMACLRLQPGTDFAAAAGHSLGEYTAYVAAGSLQFEDALRVVRRRGELMFQAGRERPGTMAAILGLADQEMRAVLASVPGIVVPANENSPGQVVISGEIEAVRIAMERCKEAGAKRVIPLEVSGAFHSPLMEGAARGLRDLLSTVEISPARIPVYANASASPVVEPDAIRESLGRQLLSPVRWEATIRAMKDAGIVNLIEIGPGRVLTGLARGIDRSMMATAVGGAEDLAVFAKPGGNT